MVDGIGIAIKVPLWMVGIEMKMYLQPGKIVPNEILFTALDSGLFV